MLEKQSKQKSSHDRRSRPREFIVGERVLVRNHRPGPDWIPGTVVEVLGPVTYLVEMEEVGQRWKRHIDQLKDWLPPHFVRIQDHNRRLNLSSSFQTVLNLLLTRTLLNLLLRRQKLFEHLNTDSSTPTEETAASSSDSAARRYPSRTRNAPDYYH